MSNAQRKPSAVLAIVNAPADAPVSLKDQIKMAKVELKELQATAKATAKAITVAEKAIIKLNAQMLKAQPAKK